MLIIPHEAYVFKLDNEFNDFHKISVHILFGVDLVIVTRKPTIYLNLSETLSKAALLIFQKTVNYSRLQQSFPNSTCQTSTWPRLLFILLALLLSGLLIILNLSVHYYHWLFPAYRYVLILFVAYLKNKSF